ncbi:asparagine synthase protein [Salinisphaera shabanensis E1L3A]|jgi:glycosyltransferase involved in cell wall biosynthesis|uniref:Asparagine synthase protein n=1 Tax=Salinisphaera shabanensis E1L3A TaxID=1033802 RepID=U2FW90_9GAMM|nr:glycosyltransferase family 4 protein [Salinisphaera shabanensis]ERJ18523.1 asparagine synthase protein [Salinisphaera shabanensis E1L3A]
MSAQTQANEHAPTRAHVLIIVENLPLPFDRRVWQQAGALRDAGYAVSIICPTAEGYRERYVEIDGIAIHRHPLPNLPGAGWAYPLEYAAALFWQLRLTTRIARRRRVDVIHACNPPDTIFLVAGLARPFGVRFLFDHHDLCPELFVAKFGRSGVMYRLMRALERATFALAKVSIATNDSFKQIACTRGGMAEEDVFVVRSGPNLDRIRALDPDPSLRKGRAHLVGYVGVMGEQEGLDDLLRMVADIVHERGRTDIQFCLVGFGPSLKSLRTLAKQLLIDEYVDFPGRLDGDALMRVLSSADICISPDPKNEMNDHSTMNKILEYMALGKALVQYDLIEGRASAADAALYARAGDRRDFADKILELIDDPALRQQLGDIGRRRIEDLLAWHHEVPKLLAAYDRVLS